MKLKRAYELLGTYGSIILFLKWNNTACWQGGQKG